MFRTARKLLGVLRSTRRVRGATAPRNDDAHLRSSRVNEARINAAIADLDAGRGKLTSLAELRDRLRDAPAR